MKIVQLFGNYFKFFYIFGQCSLKLNSHKQKLFIKKRNMFAVIYFLLSLYGNVFVLSHRSKNSSYTAETFRSSIIHVVTVLSHFVCTTSAYTTIMNAKHEYEFCVSFEKILHRFDCGKQGNHYRTNGFVQFKGNYFRKCFVIFSLTIIANILKYALHSVPGKPMFRITLLISNFLSNLVKIRILFYVDLLNTCYDLISKQNQMLVLDDHYVDDDGDLVPCFNFDEFINHIRLCKYIHFKLWEMGKFINQCAGWMFSTTLLMSGVDASYNAYRVFMHFRKSDMGLSMNCTCENIHNNKFTYNRPHLMSYLMIFATF